MVIKPGIRECLLEDLISELCLEGQINLQCCGRVEVEVERKARGRDYSIYKAVEVSDTLMSPGNREPFGISAV